MSALPSVKNAPVSLAAGAHIWAPDANSEALVDEILVIMRKHNITKIDTARSYVCLSHASPPLLFISLTYFD